MAFHRVHLKSTGSTNTHARELLRRGGLSGTGIITAERQTRGRGRHGRPWHSDNALGLWATIYFARQPRKGFYAVACVSTAAAEALAEHGADATLKWPNDVEVRRKKICGVLAEHVDGHTLVGFGVNLRQREHDFPEDVRGRATSLFLESGADVASPAFLNTFLRHFHRLNALDDIFPHYRRRLGIVGRAMAVDGLPIVVKDVTPDGALIGVAESGRKRTFRHGSLTWRGAHD